MSERDIVSNEYFEDKERFADLLNGYCFGGQEIILPENVQAAGQSVSRIQRRQAGLKTQAMIRDIVRLVHVQMKVMIVVTENQSDIHYAMPVRVMNEESAGYHRQWRAIAKKHKRKKDLKGAEFLSGFAKDDRLAPTATIVLYFGEEPWDGPKCLWDMLDLADVPKEFRELIADYPIHLLEVRKYPHLDRFRTDIRSVFGFLQNAGDGERLKEYIKEHRRELTHLEQDAYDLISVMTNTGELADVKPGHVNKEGGVDMCNGIRELIEEGRQEGRQEGRLEGRTVGIQLAVKVIRMKSAGKMHEEIAEECQISITEVEEILDGVTLAG